MTATLLQIPELYLQRGVQTRMAEGNKAFVLFLLQMPEDHVHLAVPPSSLGSMWLKSSPPHPLGSSIAIFEAQNHSSYVFTLLNGSGVNTTYLTQRKQWFQIFCSLTAWAYKSDHAVKAIPCWKFSNGFSPYIENSPQLLPTAPCCTLALLTTTSRSSTLLSSPLYTQTGASEFHLPESCFHQPTLL